MKLNTKSIYLVIVCTLWVHTIFAQYFIRTYPTSDRQGSLFGNMQVGSDGSYILQKPTYCEGDKICQLVQKMNNKYEIEWSRELKDVQEDDYTQKVRNDTIFYSGNARSWPDSTQYWYFGMMTTDGDSIAQYKYRMARISEVYCTRAGCQFPDNYGLTFVGDDEVVLFGEGLLIEDFNGQKTRKSVFLRVGLDGQQIGDLLWFDLNELRNRRMVQCVTDIDGRLVFSYEYRKEYAEPGSRDWYAHAIVKLEDDNQFRVVSEIRSVDTRNSYPRITIGNEGNYYINSATMDAFKPGDFGLSFPHEIAFLNKIGQDGKLIWQSYVPPINGNKELAFFAAANTIDGISIGQNGDVFCFGTTILRDSTYEADLEKTVKISGGTSYIAKFTSEGELVWRHFIVRPIDSPNDYKTLYFPVIRSLVELADGDLLLAGAISRSPGYNTPNDALLMRLTPDGCLNDACDHVGKYWYWPDSLSSATTPDIVIGEKLLVYPNPTRDKINFTLPNNFIYPLRYEVVQIATGQRVEYGVFEAHHDTQLEVGYLPSGIYILHVIDPNGKIAIGKVAVE